jgi:hypothetical protein
MESRSLSRRSLIWDWRPDTVKRRVFRQHGAVAEVAEAFADRALLGVALDRGSNERDGFVDGDVGGEKAVQARAVVLGAEVKRVFVRRAADEANLREVGTRATVGAAGDAQADGVVAQPGFVQHRFEFLEDFGQHAFAFRKRQPTGRQRDA